MIVTLLCVFVLYQWIISGYHAAAATIILYQRFYCEL